MNLSSLDLVLFFFVIFITIAAIVWGQKRLKSKNTDELSFVDYLLMGRQLTLPMFVTTLVATWYGGIFGVTRIAFESGIYTFITQGTFWYITYIFFALFLVHRVRQFEAMTLPELIGKMYGPRSRKLASIFNILNVIPVVYTISLGLLVQMAFGLDTLPSMVLGMAAVSLYSLFGGFRAVVFSDMVQFFFMCLGVFLVAYFSVTTYGGWDFLQQKLPETHFSVTGGYSWSTTLVWGLIAVSTLVDPNFYQRCFAAKSTKVARRGILLSTLVWMAFDICTTMGGMYARAVMAEAPADKAYFLYAMELLPSGLRGLFLAGILATILSTIDSYLFVAGSTMSYDLFRFKKNSINKTRISILFTAAVSIALAVFFEGNIKTVWKTLGTYSTACLLFPVLCGYFVKSRISDKQFLYTCLSAVVTTSYWRNASLSGFWANIDELYIGVFTTAVLMVFFHLTQKEVTTKSLGSS